MISKGIISKGIISKEIFKEDHDLQWTKEIIHKDLHFLMVTIPLGMKIKEDQDLQWMTKKIIPTECHLTTREIIKDMILWLWWMNREIQWITKEDQGLKWMIKDPDKKDPLLANKDLGLDSKDQDPILVNKVQVLEVQDLILVSKVREVKDLILVNKFREVKDLILVNKVREVKDLILVNKVQEAKDPISIKVQEDRDLIFNKIRVIRIKVQTKNMFLTSQAKEIGTVVFVKNLILENVRIVSVVVYQEMGNKKSSKTTEGMVIGIVWNVVLTIFHGVHFASNLNVKLRNRGRKEVPFVVTGEILKDLILETKDILDKLNRPCIHLNPRPVLDHQI